MRNLAFPVLIGLGGLVILIGLGVWQLQRLQWKEGILATIDDRMSAPAMALPDTPIEERDEYCTVRARGMISQPELHVLTSGTEAGSGYRVISAFTLQNGRKVMLDQGLLPFDDASDPPPARAVEVEGTLLWPDDVTSSTPAPDLEKNLWYARDVAPMAKVLGTEPVLLVLKAADSYDPRITPLPYDTRNIKNDHLQYAITWFLLAIVWTGMTAYWITRTIRGKAETT